MYAYVKHAFLVPSPFLSVYTVYAYLGLSKKTFKNAGLVPAWMIDQRLRQGLLLIGSQPPLALLTHWLSVPAYFLNYPDSFKLHVLSTLGICCWNLNVSSFMSWLTFKNSRLYIIKVRGEEQTLTRTYLYK